MNKLKKKIKHFWKNFKTVLKRPEMNVLPGSFAYYLVLSIVPTITLITYAASFFNVPSSFIFEFLAKALNKDIKVFEVSCREGIGIDEVSKYLKEHIRNKKIY